MKRIFLSLLLVCLALPLGAAELQFVESVPEETVYGSQATARPWGIWLESIKSAKKTLDIEQFYISDRSGELLESVLEAVKEAARRKVKTRFIVDAVMMGESGRSLPGLREAGVEVRVIDFKKKGGGGVQHSKFFVVDGGEVFVGSQNFDWRSLKHIHEVGIRIKSERAAADFGRIFEIDWTIAGGGSAKKLLSKKNKNPVTAANPEEALIESSSFTVKYSLAFSPVGFIPKGFDTEIDAMKRLIADSKKTLRGQVMTYALSEHGAKRWAELDEAFRIAAARGVKVELVFADWGMGGKADRDIKALSKTDNIEIKISSLPAHSSGFIPYSRVEHCKYLVADEETGFVSTSNWGPGYFLSSRGAAVVIKGSEGSRVLEDIFSRVWNGPYVQPVDPLKDYQPVKRN